MSQKGLAPVLIVILIATLIGGYLVYSGKIPILPKTYPLTNQPLPSIQQVKQPVKTIVPSPTPLVTQAKVTPVSDLNNQSLVEITPRIAAAMLPLEPSQVTVKSIASTIVVKWRGTGEDNSIEYEVYRRPSNIQDWQQLSVVKSVGDNQGQYEFTDTTPWSNAYDSYIYGIASRNGYGRRSSTISESTEITVP